MTFDNKIALSAYYKSLGLTNVVIAALLRVDASSVSRYLKQAEEARWLHYDVRLELPTELDLAVRGTLRAPDLEQALHARLTTGARGFALRQEGVVVVASGPSATRGSRRQAAAPAENLADAALHLRMLGVEAARLLVDLLAQRDVRQPTVLGTTWGRGTGSVVASLASMTLPEIPELLVVPLQGGVGRTASSADSSQYYPDILAERLSLLFRSRRAPALITLPAYIDAQTAKEVGDDGLRAIWRFIDSDASFQVAKRAHGALDIGVIGIGGFEPDAWAISSGYLGHARLVATVKREGACGDIVCRLFRNTTESPIEGWAPSTASTETIRRTNLRAIGISLSALAARVDSGARVLAVAGGHWGKKARAIHAAVRNGFVTDLVTDDVTAAAILALEE